MSIINLHKGDYIQDPQHGQWRFAMVTRDVEIDTEYHLYASIDAIWVDEHLFEEAVEVELNVFVPDILDIAPVEKDVLFHYIGMLMEEARNRVKNIIDGNHIVPFDFTTTADFDDGDISRITWEKE